MKEINIAKAIIKKRKEKGITQDQLAAYIGVSKASVSKWETGQSYPDITFLPQLAAYFNISVDELIGYSPQMKKEDIRRTYLRLSSEFGKKPFDEVMDECDSVIKKYYSCFPLLLQMAVLLLNHYMLAADDEKQREILQKIIGLCVRIKEESEDVGLSKQANSVEALCYMTMQQPQEVFDLLDSTLKPISSDETLLANAYQMTGEIKKAKEVLQVSIFQHLMIFISNLMSYMMLYINESEKFEEILRRIISVLEAFNLNKLNPNTTLQIYLAAAQGYAAQNNAEKSVDMLRRYADICISGFFPAVLHGDEFFDSIDGWFGEFDLGTNAPRNEMLIKDSMIDCIKNNPAFSLLKENPDYKRIILKMEAMLSSYNN